MIRNCSITSDSNFILAFVQFRNRCLSRNANTRVTIILSRTSLRTRNNALPERTTRSVARHCRRAAYFTRSHPLTREMLAHARDDACATFEVSALSFSPQHSRRVNVAYLRLARNKLQFVRVTGGRREPREHDGHITENDRRSARMRPAVMKLQINCPKDRREDAR